MPTKPNQQTPSTYTSETLLRPRSAAELYSLSEATLRKSRTTGKLFGRTAPPFIKMGHSIFYRVGDLEQWFSQFPKGTSNQEIADSLSAA